MEKLIKGFIRITIGEGKICLNINESNGICYETDNTKEDIIECIKEYIKEEL